MQPFWSNDFTILFNKNYIMQVWPVAEMSYEEKLNAITRCIILATLFGYFLTGAENTSILFIGLITIAIIYWMYHQRKAQAIAEGFSQNVSLEPMAPPVKIQDSDELQKAIQSEFQPGSRKNPYSNVLLTDIMDNPDKKAAPPAFNLDVQEKITKDVKRSVQMMNPGIDNTNKQLYGDLWSNFELDQSDRRFFSTANSKVVNDQGAFAQFLYGNMPSGKSSGPDGDLARVQDNVRYTLY
jgi:hypothetical protein